MVELEKEKQLIKERISELEKNEREAGKYNEFMIANGRPILKVNVEEYLALVRMQEIINNNFEQKSKYEYIEEREKTSLGHIDDDIYQKFINNSHEKDYIAEEKAKVESRISKIISDYRFAGKGVLFSQADNGQMVISDNVEEFNSLLKMKKLLDLNLNTPNYYDYMNLRVMTELGQMSDIDYANLMGRINDKDYSQPVIGEEKVDGKRKYTGPEIIIGDQPQDTMETPVENPIIPPEPSEQPVEESPVDQPANNGGSGEDVEEPTNVEEEIPQADGEVDEPEEEIDEIIDEEPIKVVKTSAWQWVKDHKKQILIALGITALSITTIVVLTQVLPALMASMKAAQVAGLASEMVTNGQMYFAASASEKLALHGANTALADVITSITGAANTFNTTTGVWTLGAQTLPEFAQSAAVAATAATSKLTTLTGISLAGGIGGLGSLGAGLMLPKKKSKAYKEIATQINNLNDAIDDLDESTLRSIAQEINNKIMFSNELTTNERNKLFRKLSSVLKKANIKTQTVQQEEIDNIENSVEEPVEETVQEKSL